MPWCSTTASSNSSFHFAPNMSLREEMASSYLSVLMVCWLSCSMQVFIWRVSKMFFGENTHQDSEVYVKCVLRRVFNSPAALRNDFQSSNDFPTLAQGFQDRYTVINHCRSISFRHWAFQSGVAHKDPQAGSNDRPAPTLPIFGTSILYLSRVLSFRHIRILSPIAFI